jgi:pimeloyl-ACP methyl ester carboxylesterase
LCALLMVALTVVTTRRGAVGWNDASFGALVAAFPNSGFMGVPLLVALLGQRAAGPAIVALAIDMIVTSSLCIALSRLDGASEHGVSRAVGNALKGMLKNPLPWSIFLGCLTTATGFQLWEPARNTIGMLADGASPVALFTIGAVLARPQREAGTGGLGDVPLVMLYKLVLHPVLVLGIGKLAQAVGVPSRRIRAHRAGAPCRAAERQQHSDARRALRGRCRPHCAHRALRHGGVLRQLLGGSGAVRLKERLAMTQPVHPLAPPAPFVLHVEDRVLDDLRQRLARTRWPDEAPGPPWSTGTSVAYMQSLTEHWCSGFDWRAHEAALNRFRQFTVPLAGIDLHFIHEPGQGPTPLPLLLSHGWPGSVFEFRRLIPLLTDPGRFGGDPADAFTVVAPSLPGFTLSFKPGQPRFGVEEMADAFAALMTDVLGYPRFGAQGGDWGSFITSRLGYRHPERVVGIHLNLSGGAARSADAAGADSRGAALPRRAEPLPEGGSRLPVDPGDEAADAGLRPERLARRPGGLDRREVPQLDRQRRRPRECRPARRDAREHHLVLGDRGHRLVVLALLRARAPRMAGARRQDGGRADGLRRVPARDPAAAALGGRAAVQRHPSLDDAAQGRPLRRAGAARGSGARDPRVLPALAHRALSFLTARGRHALKKENMQDCERRSVAIERAHKKAGVFHVQVRCLPTVAHTAASALRGSASLDRSDSRVTRPRSQDP